MRRSCGDKLPNRDEAGQVLILSVFFLVLAVVIAAFVVDLGLFLRERRQLQNTADAAALAGVAELPDLPGEALLMAENWAVANGIDLTDPDYTFEAATPYDNSSSKIEVEVSHRKGVFFPSLLSPFQNVSARAVAQVRWTGAYAIFVIDSSCGAPDPFEFSGSTSVVNGAVHSNSNAKVNGSDNSFFDGPLTYSCNFDNAGQNNTYLPNPQQTGYIDPPVEYAFSDFPCTETYTEDTDLSSRPEVWVNDDPDTNQLKPGVYCSTQDLQLGGQDVSGNVTLVAGDELKISGSDFSLTAYFEGVLGFSSASHDSAIDISGSGGDWTGLINAPNGRVKFQGSDDLSLTGSIVAHQVSVSGSDFSINAVGDPGPPVIALVE